MTNTLLPFPLAQSSLTFLVYLLVGAFWLIGNLLQQKQAKQKALEMQRKREEEEAEERRTGKKKVQVAPKRPIESKLEAFLGQLSGEPVRQTAAATPPITRRKVVDDIVFDTPPPAPPIKTTPPPRKFVPPKRVPGSTIGDLDMAASFKQISDIKEASTMFAGGIDQVLQQRALTNVKTMLIDLSSTTISIPRVPMQSIRPVHTKSPRPDLQKKRSFKKAMVAAVILQPPKALQENPFTETP